MKNNKLFLKIYIVLLAITTVTLITLYVLGSKTRIGYLSNLSLNINQTLYLNDLNAENIKKLFTIGHTLNNEALINYVFTNKNITNYSYDFKIQYYSKIFKHSDVYGVYIDTNKIIQDNNFIKEINMDLHGSPFGTLISTKIIDFEKIDNVNYNLKIHNYIIIIFLILLLIYFYINYIYPINFCIQLKLHTLMIIGYIYLILPYIIFILTWIKLSISIPILVILFISLFFV